LAAFRRVDAKQANALTVNLDGVAIDNGGNAHDLRGLAQHGVCREHERGK
jgi:hypothetical protein